MPTLVVFPKGSSKTIQVQAGVSRFADPYELAAYSIEAHGYVAADCEAIIIEGDYTATRFHQAKQIIGGQIVDRQKTLAEAQAKALKVVNRKYNQLCTGTDPETGKNVYVDCVTASGTFRMNAGKDAADKMDGGVRIFERQGATHMPVVRDFDNTNHANVPIADAIAISVQQGAEALSHWQQKGIKVDAINAATTVAEVNAVDLTFSVNVES